MAYASFHGAKLRQTYQAHVDIYAIRMFQTAKCLANAAKTYTKQQKNIQIAPNGAIG